MSNTRFNSESLQTIKKFKKGELEALISKALLNLDSTAKRDGVVEAFDQVSSMTDAATEKRIFDAIKELYLRPTTQGKVAGKGIQLNSGHTLEPVMRASLEYLYMNNKDSTSKVEYIEKSLREAKRDNLSALLGGDIEITSNNGQTARIQVKSYGASLAIYQPNMNLQDAGGLNAPGAIDFLQNPEKPKGEGAAFKREFLTSALNNYVSTNAANLYLVGLTSRSGVGLGEFTSWDSKGVESNRTLTFGALVSMMMAVQLTKSQFKGSVLNSGSSARMDTLLKIRTKDSGKTLGTKNSKSAEDLFDLIMDSKIGRNQSVGARQILQALKNQDRAILQDLLRLSGVPTTTKGSSPEQTFIQLFEKIFNAKMQFFPDVKYSQEMISLAAAEKSGQNYVLHAPSGRLLYLSMSAIANPMQVQNYFNRWRGKNAAIFNPLFGGQLQE